MKNQLFATRVWLANNRAFFQAALVAAVLVLTVVALFARVPVTLADVIIISPH